MLPNDRVQPATRDKSAWPGRIMSWIRRSPTWMKVVVVAAALLFSPVTLGVIVIGGLCYAIFAVVKGRRSGYASASVAIWGMAVFSAVYSGRYLFALLLLPVLAALAAHAR